MTPGPRRITADGLVAIACIAVIVGVALTVILSL
jgi:hypothetical protein